MAIDFPTSPTNGQTFVVGTVTYTWDGTKWTAVAAGGGGGGSGDKIQEGNTSAEVIDTGSDGRFVVTTEGSEALRVDSSGRLGVGTASPSATLHLSAAQAEVKIQSTSGTNPGYLSFIPGGVSNPWYIYANSSRNLIFDDFATEQLRITSDRYVRLAAGTGGIQFNGDTAAANALDDYEEGTWTPTVQNFTVSGSSTLTGSYTKIGRVVYFDIRFFNTGTIAFGVSAFISLPFAGVYESGMVAMSVDSNSEPQTSGKNGVQHSMDTGNSRFFVGNFTTTTAGHTLKFSGFYRVS